MLYFPELLKRGEVPNVDFLHLYGPGSLHFLAGWYEIFGDSLAVERTFGLLQNLGIILGLYVIGRMWGRGVAAGTGVVAAVIIMTPIGLQAMAWHGALAFGIWTVVFALRARQLFGRTALINWGVAGLLGGLALSFRPDIVIAVGAVVAYAGWRDRRLAWKPVAVGAVDRPDPDVGASRHGRSRRVVRGDGPRPGVRVAARSRAAVAAVARQDRRLAAAGRRVLPAVVGVARPRRVQAAVPVVLGNAHRRHRRARLRLVASTSG